MNKTKNNQKDNQKNKNNNNNNNFNGKLGFLTFLVSILFIFSGCGEKVAGDQGGFPKIGGGSSGDSTGGLTMGFAEGNPQNEMIKGVPQNFAFVFRNNQNHEISDLKIKAKGFDKNYVPALSEFVAESGKSVDVIPRATKQAGAGVYDGLIISGIVVDGFEGNFDFNPTFDYCYTAKSTHQEQICVPSNKNTCDVDIQKSIEKNGPLTVSIDTITPIESKIRLDFTITNSGNGKVLNNCFDTDDYSNEYRNLDVKLGSVQGTCTQISGSKIIQNKANFYCEFDRSSDESYSSQIVVTFDYLYQQSFQKNIQVKDLNNNNY